MNVNDSTSIPPLTEEIMFQRLESNGWKKNAAGDRLEKTFDLRDFNGSMAFINKVAEIANNKNHHPDFTLSWNLVTITTWTHTTNSLTAKDAKLAEALDLIKTK